MLQNNLENYRRIADCAELIFVDGGSGDGSLDILRAQHFKVLTAPRGRARQMNSGARASCGQHLLFLHADTKVPESFLAALAEISASRWGFFKIALSKKRWPFTWIAASINFRARLLKIATGDQGLFVERELFFSLGAFPDIELMEDIALTRQLRNISVPTILSTTLETSSRRWESRGVVKTILQMWFLQLAYKCGVAPKTLRQWYQ